MDQKKIIFGLAAPAMCWGMEEAAPNLSNILENLSCQPFLHLPIKKIIEPYFDGAYYIKSYRKEVIESSLSPFDHFLRKGFLKKYLPSPKFNTDLFTPLKESCERIVNLMVEDKKVIAPHFNEDFYLSNYGTEVLKSKLPPLDHFMHLGVLKGYKPNCWFDPKIYQKYFPCERNPFADWLQRPPGVSKEKRSVKLTVTLTSWEPRFPWVWLTIESLLRQEVQPDEIILWVSFEDADKIPKVIEMLKLRGLQIRFCENLKSYKKLEPALREDPRQIYVTFDDDAIYPPSRLKFLYEAHLQHSKDIICGGVSLLVEAEGGGLKPFSQSDWSFNVRHPEKELEASPLICIEGMGGVLYCPGALDMKYLDKEFLEKAPTNDDLLFTMAARSTGASIRKVNVKDHVIIIDEGAYQETSLYRTNFANGGQEADLQWENLQGIKFQEP